jgi:hypothetical protein
MRAMAVRDEVRALIQRLSPDPICDGCITARLSLSARHHADLEPRVLAGTRGFERLKDRCSICGNEKNVSRFHPK